LTEGAAAAQDHVLDEMCVKAVALAKGGEHLRSETYWCDLVQSAVGASLAPRRAHMVVDVGRFSHGWKEGRSKGGFISVPRSRRPRSREGWHGCPPTNAAWRRNTRRVWLQSPASLT